MTDKQQTALQWLCEQLAIAQSAEVTEWLWTKALEMEREQIEQAFDDGYSRMSGYSMSDDYYDSNYANN